MKRVFVGILLSVFVNSFAYSQEVVFVTKQGYEGYIFPKDFPIWGFPPEANRYTPNEIDIEIVESIIRSNVKIICTKLMHKQYGDCRAKRFLRKYIRQYVGYVTEDKQIIIKVYFAKKGIMDIQEFKNDIIWVQDGGVDYWNGLINITTMILFDLSANGES